jgi:cell division ATPase FtsA
MVHILTPHCFGDLPPSRQKLTGGSSATTGIMANASQSLQRNVYANSPYKNDGFADNAVTTAKYRAHTFVFVRQGEIAAQSKQMPHLLWLSQIFLLEQFSRFANAYFLLVCCLQVIPSITITGGLPTAGLPLTMVLLFDGVVTAREDYKRHKDDHVTNTQRSESIVTLFATCNVSCITCVVLQLSRRVVVASFLSSGNRFR